MFVKYKINTSILSGVTATTINIPINIEYQIVDNAELVERVFVEVETQKAINPILDYEKARYIPVDNALNQLGKVMYQLYFLGSNNTMQVPTYYSNIGFDDSDINFGRNNFKESYLYLGFYDSDNQLTQNLVTELEIFSMLTSDDFYPAGTAKPNIAGQPKPASQIPIRFVLSSPMLMRQGFYEGYYIYDYKDAVSIDLPKYLYMKSTYINAKSGKSTNLMTEPIAYKIDGLIPKLYTRYKLYRDTNGFYYQIDTTYSNNVSYSINPNNTDVVINLYQTQTL
jgi:hypothetical protein